MDIIIKIHQLGYTTEKFGSNYIDIFKNDTIVGVLCRVKKQNAWHLYYGTHYKKGEKNPGYCVCRKFYDDEICIDELKRVLEIDNAIAIMEDDYNVSKGLKKKIIM